MPRFRGPATLMRLPPAADAAGPDACFVAVPLDVGTSIRSGTRFGPRRIRTAIGRADLASDAGGPALQSPCRFS
jgi:arginase family enzyme